MAHRGRSDATALTDLRSACAPSLRPGNPHDLVPAEALTVEPRAPQLSVPARDGVRGQGCRAAVPSRRPGNPRPVFSGATRNSLVILPLALSVTLALAPVVVVTQNLVELVGMVEFVRLISWLIADRMRRHKNDLFAGPHPTVDSADRMVVWGVNLMQQSAYGCR